VIPGSASQFFLGASQAASGATGLQVSRSLRYSSVDSSYCSRTPSVAGNRKTWTWSGWMKRSALGSFQFFFCGGVTANDTDQFVVYFRSVDTLAVTSGVTVFRETSQVFRDTSAFFHLLIAVDTTQATANDRIKVYVNGSQVTAFSTTINPAQNADTGINTAAFHTIGRNSLTPEYYFNGYLANVQFIDGQALTPSSFTEVSATTGQLSPKAYTGNYGIVSVAAATGGLPIWNTTDTYGAAKGSGTRTDASSSSIVLALPMDGTNGGTSFGDQSATIKGSGSAKTVTVNGNTNTSTAQSKFYGSSAYFDGAGDYLTLGSSADFAFGTGDFTIEAFVYRPSGGGLQIFDHLMGAGNFTIFSYSNQAITVYSNAAYSSGVNPGNDRWFHLAVVRSSGVLSFFIDGVKAANTYSFTLNMTTAGVNIGSSQYSEYGTQYLQDLRVYKGLAKYTTNFSPVTISNSFYLQFADNSSNTASTLGKDTSGNGNNWTPNNFSVVSSYDTVVSNIASASTTWGNINNAFDGNTSTYADGTGNNGTVSTITFNRPLTGVTLLEYYWGGTSTYGYNSTSVGTGPSSGSPGYVTAYSGSAITVNNLRAVSQAGDGVVRVYAIRVNGTVLTGYTEGNPAGNDSLVDTPTSNGTDTGAGGEVRGNYATLNPLDKAVDVTLSNGNLEISHSGSSNLRGARATIKLTTGKWYCEAVRTTGSDCHSGIITASSSLFQFASTSVFYGEDGKLYVDGSVATNYGITIAIGDVVGIAVDMDAAKIYFYKNGTLINTGGTSFTTTGNDWFFKIGTYFSSSVNTVNFGQRAFAYPVSGYKALVDTNLGTPVVAKPNTVMDVVTYTGSGVIQTISGLQFSSDLLWIKCRSTLNTYHTVADTVRGIGSNGAYYRLFANATDPEYDDGFDVTAITSTGFTLPLGSSSTNSATATYVAWAWDAGTTTASNTAGSITSQVRANVSAGFSVVTYTGTGSNATVGHALGVAAGLVIVKRRDTTANWQVRHTSIAAASSIQLNLTNAAASATTVWNSTAPSSTVFSIGTDATINASAGTYVAYCFASVAGYSNAFSYTGNGLEDGVFVYLGFRPRLIMLKRSDSTSGWTLLDTSRLGYNIDNNPLYANTLAAEAATDLLDITSNGFKLRTTDVSVNASTGTYIGFAWAESPFQYARAR